MTVPARCAPLLALLLSSACVLESADPDPADRKPVVGGKADVVLGSCTSADCGAQSVDGCWCDALCVEYGDCCEDAHDVCELDAPCSEHDVEGQGECLAALGYAWDGERCVVLTGCDCVGSDCDALFGDLDTCLAENVDCTDDIAPTCDELGGQCRSSPDDEALGADCEADFDAPTLAGTCEAFNLTCCALDPPPPCEPEQHACP